MPSGVDETDYFGLPLLHGTLKVHIIEAKGLPDTDTAFFNISRDDVTDPFVEVSVGKTALLKTAVIRNCLDPVWDEKFSVPVCHNASCIKVQVSKVQPVPTPFIV